MERVLIRNRTRSTVVAHNAELANTRLSRLRGLIGRRSLASGEGLIIHPCKSIHSCFMAFPIDVLFVDEGHRVLRAAGAIPPWRIGPVVSQARYVVELPVGTLLASRTVEGDELEWVT